MGVDLSHLGGWIDDGGHEIYARGLPVFGDHAPDLLLDAKPSTPILLYKAWKALGGAYPPYVRQVIGDCVSFGHGHGNDLLQCVEAYRGEPSVPAETMTEFVYGESRKVGHILGPFDGSYGSAAVKAMTAVGIVSRAIGGGAYDGSRAKKWGMIGPPSDLEAKAAQYKLKACALIKTEADAISCLWNGSPFTICSSQGFDTTRDRDGFCRASGVWKHCMMVAGWRPNPEGFLICQSWGPNSPSGPLDLDQPSFSFWCDTQTMVRHIISAGDSWGLFGAPDFVRRSLPGEFYRA